MMDAAYAALVDFKRPVQSVIPGVPGRVLAVLVETTAELSLRTIARLAGASPAQASRVLPRLVELGLVERREVPPAALFRLVPEHLAAGPLADLARAGDRLLEEMGHAAAALPTAPAGVILFGSLSRGEADAQSDIDVVVVRPAGVPPDDEQWWSSLDQWSGAVRGMSGNRVELLEIGVDEIAARLAGSEPLWRGIRRSGVVVFGLGLEELASLEPDA